MVKIREESMFSLDNEHSRWGSISLENLFFEDFLPAAKSDYIKIYLYCLYLCREGKDGGGPDGIAEKLNVTTEEIFAAMRYWERRGLVTKVTNDPVQYEFHSCRKAAARGEDCFTVDNEYVEFSENVYGLFGARRKVTVSEIARAYEWVADFGLSCETVLMLISHMIARRGVNFSFSAAEKMACRMKEEKVETLEDAEAFFSRDEKVHNGCRDVLRSMGKRREASEAEMKLYSKWIYEWHFDGGAVLAACDRMTGGDPSFSYLDSILARLNGTEENKTAAGAESRLESEKKKREEMRLVLEKSGLEKTLTLGVFEPLFDTMTATSPLPVVLLAAAECAAGRSREGRVEKIQMLLESWKGRGLEDEESVKKYLENVKTQNAFLRKLFESMDREGSPTAADRETLKVWQANGMTEEMLLLAAGESRGAAGNKLRYMDKIIASWIQNGVKTPDEARKAAAVPAADRAVSRKLNAQNYDQREYSQKEIDEMNERFRREVLDDDE